MEDNTHQNLDLSNGLGLACHVEIENVSIFGLFLGFLKDGDELMLSLDD